jgi:alpha-1,2-mannosyltransferase
MRLSLAVLRRHAPIVVAGILSGLYGWAMLIATFAGHDGAIGLGFNAMGADWIIWEEAARAVHAGLGAHIYDQSWITHMVNRDYAHWLSQPLPYPVFPYPPVSLLLISPFAWLPLPASVLAFEIFSAAVLALALLKLVDDRSTRLFFLLGVLFSAASAMNVAAGQNGFLIPGILVGGFALLETNPLAAGAVLALLVFKPQFLPLACIALMATRSWRAITAMAISIAALIALSVLFFGAQLWLDWIASLLHPDKGTGVNGTVWGHMWDSTVSTCLSLLGLPAWVANIGQAFAALLAVAMTWLTFRAPLAFSAKLGALLCLTLLASPHMSSYDMVALAIAALIAIADLRPDAGSTALFLALLAYAAPIFDPPRHNALGLTTPLILIGLACWFVLPLIRSSPLVSFKPRSG